jgi:hypothetical protein
MNIAQRIAVLEQKCRHLGVKCFSHYGCDGRYDDDTYYPGNDLFLGLDYRLGLNGEAPDEAPVTMADIERLERQGWVCEIWNINYVSNWGNYSSEEG